MAPVPAPGIWGSETEVSDPVEMTAVEKRKAIRREANAAREKEKAADSRPAAVVTDCTAQAFTAFGDIENTAALISGSDKVAKAVDEAVASERAITGYSSEGRLVAAVPATSATANSPAVMLAPAPVSFSLKISTANSKGDRLGALNTP